MSPEFTSFTFKLDSDKDFETTVLTLMSRTIDPIGYSPYLGFNFTVFSPDEIPSKGR